MRKKSWSTLFPSIHLLFCVLATSCGKGFSDKKINLRQEQQAVAQFGANLKPLNSGLGVYKGRLTLSIIDNQFWARTAFNGPYTTQMSTQYIHTGSRCPTMRDDLNGDGYLDFIETHMVVGNILIPLDSKLESQLKGLNKFPKLRRNNKYYYSESTHFDRLMDDLTAEDSFSMDFITKLAKGEKLALTSRVVLVYGVNEERILPMTVASYDSFSPQSTLPVACGEIYDYF